jgi:hypothetical protein
MGYYTNLVIGGIYLFPEKAVPASRLESIELYAPALKACINQHAFLSATIQNVNQEPVFSKAESMNLQNHYRVLRHDNFKLSSNNETAILVKAIEHLHNDEQLQFTDVVGIPTWALDIVVLPTPTSSKYHRVFISFTYSHSHGDGMSGLAFHHTFHDTLQQTFRSSENTKEELIFDSPAISIPDQPDTPSAMPISLLYLLNPLLSTCLPTFITTLLGVSGSLSGTDPKTWEGSPTFIDNKTPGLEVTTSVELLSIPSEHLTSALALCKKNSTTLTPWLNHLIAESVSEALTSFGESLDTATNFVSQIPINMRKALGVSNSVMGNYPSLEYLRYEHRDLAINESTWRNLQDQSQKLASSVSSRRDQPIALLRYVSNLGTWMQSKIGTSRGCSWEFSNLGSFDPGSQADLRIEKMVFSQPASPLSAPLTFSVVGTRNAGLDMALTWQIGALGLMSTGDEPKDQKEERFVQLVLDTLSKRVGEIGE